jgi:outer membrane protein assembly factor BamB
MRILGSMLTLFILLSIGYNSHAQISAWPMFRHDLQHTGRTPYTGPASPYVSWTYQTDEAIASSVSFGADGTIYFGSGYITAGGDSSLYALNRDGSLKWRFKMGSGIFSSPAIGPDGTIYVGSLDRNLYAVEDSVTYGKLKWKFPSILWFYSSPAIGADGTIYVGGLDFNLYAINPDGTEKWRYRTDWCVFSSPIIGPEGEIYVGSKDHNLYALEDSLIYANLRWKHPFGTFFDGHLVDSSPAMGPDGTLYVGVDPYGAAGQTPVPIDTAFYAVNPDGTRRWSVPMGPDGTESSPAIGPDGMVYIGANDGNLYAIRDLGDDYVLEWAFQTGGPIDGSPTVDGCGTIYIGSRDSTLYAINSDGSLRWSHKTEGGIEASPTIDENGILYIGSFDGKLYAIGDGSSDVGVDSIDLPDEVTADSEYTPRAVVQNYRIGAQSFEVACVIDTAGVSVYQDTVTVGNLPATTPYEVVFEPWTVPQDTGIVYRVTVAALLEGDGNAYNDTFVTEARSVGEYTTDICESETPPFSLGQCYPNPFNPSTTIRFTLGEAARVRLGIYDVSGRLVRVLLDDRRGAGSHNEMWDGTDHAGRGVSSGVYFYRLEAGAFIETKKMVLLR